MSFSAESSAAPRPGSEVGLRGGPRAPLSVLSVVAALGAARAAGAQEATAAGEQAIPTVRVTGEAPARSASESVKAADVVRAAPHRTGGDLLLLVPGMFVTQHGGQGKAHQLFYRGFDSIHGQDIELWVGGAPVNEVSNVHGQGYADLHFVMPEIVRAIRAQPGPYDPRQGDFAVAGTTRFDLGYDEPGLTMKGSVGSYGEKRLFAAYHPRDLGPESFVAFEVAETDGFGPSRAARRTSGVAQHVLSLGRGTALRVLATAYAGRFDAAGVLPEADIDAGRVDRFATYDPKQGGASVRGQLVVELTRETEDGRLTFAPFFVLRSLKLRQNFTGFLEYPYDGDSQQQRNDATTFGATGSYRRKLTLLSSRDTLEGGLFLRTDWVSQSQLALGSVGDRVLETSVRADVRAVNVAGYVDASVRPFPRFVVRGGVRVDGLFYNTDDLAPVATTAGGSPAHASAAGVSRSAQGSRVSPRVTVDLALGAGVHLVGSYGEGFRSPQARSLAEGERTPFTTVRSFEVGTRWRGGGGLEASFAGYHTALSDDLVFDPRTARNETVPSTERVGLAADAVFRPVPWFVASVSLTYTRAAFTSSDASYGKGDLVPYVPQLVSRQDIAFSPELGTLWNRPVVARLGAGLTGLVNRPLPFSEWGHDVFLVDATAGVRRGEVELRLDVFNLLDTPWYDGQFVYASSFTPGAAPSLVPARHVTAGAPRTFLATLALYL